MLNVATLILTIVSAVSIGVLCGWAVLSAMLFVFSINRKKELQPAKSKPAVDTTQASSA